MLSFGKVVPCLLCISFFWCRRTKLLLLSSAMSTFFQLQMLFGPFLCVLRAFFVFLPEVWRPQQARNTHRTSAQIIQVFWWWATDPSQKFENIEKNRGQWVRIVNASWSSVRLTKTFFDHELVLTNHASPKRRTCCFQRCSSIKNGLLYINRKRGWG